MFLWNDCWNFIYNFLAKLKVTKAHTIIALAKLFCCSFVSGKVGVKVKYENNFHPRKKYDIILENCGRKAFRHDTTSDTGDVPGSWLVIILYQLRQELL